MGKATGVKKVKGNPRPIYWQKIPSALLELPQWVCWKSRKRGGKDKPEKVPIDPKTRRNAAVNDPKTWASFAKAKECWEGWEVDGIGFVLTEDDPYVVIDQDNCRNPQSKVLTEPARQIVNSLQSYSEVSPSGTGVHTWVQGSVPRSVRESGVEIYKAGRFITVTGWHLQESSPPTIARRDRELQELFLKTASSSDAKGNERGNSAKQVSLSKVQQRRITGECAGGPEGAKFQRLWAGDTEGYSSQSEADLGLCRILALHTGCHGETVDVLFRRSELFREKWDEIRSTDGRTYGEMTIEKAVNRATDELKRKFAVRSAEDSVEDPPEGETQYLINALIPRKTLGIVAGHSSLGKSPLLYQAGICVAAGTPFLGRKVQSGSVLYLDFENARSQSDELICGISSHLGLNNRPENFYYWNLSTAADGWKQDNTLDMIRNFKPDLAILDSYTAFDPDIERDNPKATQSMLKLRQIIRDVGTTIVGTHHLTKPSSRKNAAPERLEKCASPRNWFFQVRGPGALINQSDVRIGVEEPLQCSSTETQTGEKEEVALVLRGFMRIEGEIPLVYVARVFDQQGEAVGYRQVTGPRLLFNSDQESSFNKLPANFRFKNAQLVYGRGPQATSDFLKKCVALQILHKINDGYEKIMSA